MSTVTATASSKLTTPTLDRVPEGVPAGGEFTNRQRMEWEGSLAASWQPGQPHPTGGYDETIYDPKSKTTLYLLEGDLHRVDGPAKVYGDGTEEFYFEGARHRDHGLPAVISSTGELEYHVHGVLHRDGDLPALVDPEGDEEYWVEGKRHRDGGRPAVVGIDGRTEYWVDGQRHRPIADGPALIRADGTVAYFEHGRELHPKRSELGA